jgi:hypothetical protein
MDKEAIEKEARMVVMLVENSADTEKAVKRIVRYLKKKDETSN